MEGNKEVADAAVRMQEGGIEPEGKEYLSQLLRNKVISGKKTNFKAVKREQFTCSR
jgi:hypothetical protein